MLRSLGTYLLIVPLLLPPGVCVCDLVASSGQAPQPESVTLSPECSGCRCQHHQRARQIAQARESADLPSAAAELPAKSDEQHLPACPAKNGSVQWKAQTVSSSHLIDRAVLPAQFELAPVVAVAAPAAVCDLCPSAPPLYLTLLTLLI